MLVVESVARVANDGDLFSYVHAKLKVVVHWSLDYSRIFDGLTSIL